MRRNKECQCNHRIVNFRYIRFKRYGYTVKLERTKCNNLIGRWYIQTEKIIPTKREWSKEERLTMR